jgi:hypothetical protein
MANRQSICVKMRAGRSSPVMPSARLAKFYYFAAPLLGGGPYSRMS